MGACSCDNSYSGDDCSVYNTSATKAPIDVTGSDGKCMHGTGIYVAEFDDCNHLNGKRVCQSSATAAADAAAVARNTADMFATSGPRCHSLALPLTLTLLG